MINVFSKLRRSRHRFLWMASLTTVLCLGVGALLAKPAYRMLREWRIERNAENAATALAAGDYAEARRLAMSVLQLHNERHDMLVILQRSMEELKDPNAVNISRALMVHPEATEEDRIRGFRETCANMPIAVATRTWRALGEEKANSPAYLTPFVTRVIDQGLPGEAAKMLLTRNDVDQHPELRFQAVRVLLMADEGKYLDRAQFEISELMQEGGKLALPGFRLLAGVPPAQFRSAYFPELEPWVAAQEGATADDRLLALIQRRHRFPEQEAEIVKEAIARFGSEDAAALGRWLNQTGRAGETLALLSAEGAATDVGRYLARADALIALERWQDAREWLAAPPENLPMIELHFRRVLCDDTPGDPTKNGKAWAAALREIGANPNPNDLLDLQQRMRDAGLEELAREAMAAALRKGRGRLPYWLQVRDLLPWLHAKQQGQAMFEVCSVMASLEPERLEVVVQALDLACVLGKIQPAALKERVEQIGSHSPEISQSPRFRELMATALLLDDKPGEAIAALGPEASGTDKASGRAMAVAAVAKAMLGDDKTSNELFKRTDWNLMLPEERKFFTGLLERLSAPGSTEPIGSRFDPKILPPSDDPIETPKIPEILPAIDEKFGEKAGASTLPPIPDAINEEFKSKPLPTLPPAKDESKPE
jgi:hypothetical protein